MELGGNSAMIVLQSAFECVEGDEAKLAKAQEIAQMIFDGAYGNSGQRCTAARMLIIDGSAEASLVYNEFVKVVENTIDIGNPFDKKNIYGALNDEGAAFKMDNLRAAAKNLQSQNYDIKIHGGGRIGENQTPKGGMYYYPAVLDWRKVPMVVLKSTEIVVGKKWDGEKMADVKTSLYEALRHETFGPLVNIVAQARSKEHAVEIVREWDAEGLAAGGVANKADLDYLASELEGKHVTSFKRNGTPKDPSPEGAHGNQGQQFHTGGEHFFESFIRPVQITDSRDLQAAQKIHGSGLQRAA